MDDIDHLSAPRKLEINPRASRQHGQTVAVLVDRRYVQLEPQTFERFAALLDDPPPPTDRLRAFLLGTALWE